MYKIINQKTGSTIGYTDEPRYIYLAPSDSYVQCDEQSAQGIAYQSNPYNLFGREPLTAEIDTVLVQKIDAGELVSQQEQKIKTLEEDLASTDEITIALYEQLASVDEALISMYENNSVSRETKEVK